MLGTRPRREVDRDARLAEILGVEPAPRWGRVRAVARTGWWVLWRQRKPLAPLGVLAGLWTVGWLLDAGDVPAPAVGLLATVAAVALWRLRYAPRLDRPVERRYAAVCLAAASMWLVAAAAAGLS